MRAANLAALVEPCAALARTGAAVRFEMAARFGAALRAARGLAPPACRCVPFFFFMTSVLRFLKLCALDQGAQRSPANQVQMQVVYLLTAVRIAIDDQPIAAFRDPVLTREIAGDNDHVPDQ